jgi:gas vesicle protein
MFKYLLFFICTPLFLTSCNKDNHNMLVQGEIKNLKKGTLYLEKISDGNLIGVDSIEINGHGAFQFGATIKSPEVYFLSLDKNPEKTIPFFGDEGTIDIQTSLERFVFNAKITGSENQSILDKYNKMAAKFQNRNLEMIKENFEAQKENNQKKLEALEKESKQLIRRNYLYTANFALNNSSSEVAPYLALTKLANANIVLLDTINASLSEEIKNSTYGKALRSYLGKIKTSEKK